VLEGHVGLGADHHAVTLSESVPRVVGRFEELRAMGVSPDGRPLRHVVVEGDSED
jgi:hypothetical protein